jgi:hypothetical protein
MMDNHSSHPTGNIEIEIPEGLARSERFKTWLNVIVVVAAIMIAAASTIKPSDNGSSEEVHKEMVKQIKALQEDGVRQRRDSAMLRKYIDDYLRKSTVVGSDESGILQPNNPNAPVILIPIDRNKIRTLPGPNAQPILVLPAGQPPPLPEMSSYSDPLPITDFKTLLEQAETSKILKERDKSKQKLGASYRVFQYAWKC